MLVQEQLTAGAIDVLGTLTASNHSSSSFTTENGTSRFASCSGKATRVSRSDTTQILAASSVSEVT